MHWGIRADSDLTMSGGKICDNAGGNLAVQGAKNLTNVTVCESALSASTQGNALLDTEISGNECGSIADEELNALNAEADVEGITP